jgi:hypothetical protein
MSVPTATSSLPDAVENGIAITAQTQCKESDGIRLRGEYKVPYTEASVPKEAILMPKHIALVVTRGGNYTAIKPFRDMVVFEDDVHDDGQCASGNFNLNVFDHIQFNGEGDYYILCSLGNYLSNVVKVTVA